MDFRWFWWADRWLGGKLDLRKSWSDIKISFWSHSRRATFKPLALWRGVLHCHTLASENTCFFSWYGIPKPDTVCYIRKKILAWERDGAGKGRTRYVRVVVLRWFISFPLQVWRLFLIHRLIMCTCRIPKIMYLSLRVWIRTWTLRKYSCQNWHLGSNLQLRNWTWKLEKY